MNEQATSGISRLDTVLQSLRLGDNVVWQVDDMDDYAFFAEPLIQQALSDGRRCMYLRFAPHPPILKPMTVDTPNGPNSLAIVRVDPSEGFDYFSSEVYRIIHAQGRGVFYVMDNLSSLVEEWASDEQLANFFQITCPCLYQLDTVAYFALLRGRHDYNAIARIRETTQVLIDVYRVKGEMYIHPLKVYGRYSPQMFLPHYVKDDRWSPISHSGEAAAVSATARRPFGRFVPNSIAPWESIYRKLIEYNEREEPLNETASEVSALRQELSRMLFGSHPTFERLAERYFRLDDLLAIRNRMIGSGRIGGKAAGMLLARRVLLQSRGEIDFSHVLENHDSFYVGSDAFFTFLVNNDLFRLRLQMSRNPDISRDDFEEVERRFLAGKFPPEIMEQFRDMLEYFGQAPIIVRSSSFLEDSFGNAFAGKYRSEFCPNQGTPDDRLQAFLQAIKLVYASALNPDAVMYRRRRGLAQNDEQMAILVQRVSGMPRGDYFFPNLAGVAFSHNLYAWNDRIDPAKGIIRLVFGLGTRAVNRVSGDYPRMISVSHPELRPEMGTMIAKYSQWHIDVLDLKSNELKTLPASEVLNDDYPNLHLLVSLLSDGYVQDPPTRMIDSEGKQLVLTFNNLIEQSDFVKIMGEMLSRLQEAYDEAVDIEFTASVGNDGRAKVNLLQCRPMWTPSATQALTLPENVPAERILFRAHRLICGGAVHDIRHILYIDPRVYAASDVELRKSLGRIVGAVNRHPNMSHGKILMMGPGRWGSSNILLGVNVGYAEIDGAGVLVELACEEEGHVPEVSYGTHFFQDLVEGQIIYLPVYPDDPEAEFNSDFFSKSRNILTDLLPQAAKYAEMVRLIDVPVSSSGAYAHVIADGQSRTAICYVE